MTKMIKYLREVELHLAIVWFLRNKEEQIEGGHTMAFTFNLFTPLFVTLLFS
jgi:uncharacterized protein (DUF2461 family)